eukprot:6190060-Pleurochrysis_carterae.AAC.1
MYTAARSKAFRSQSRARTDSGWQKSRSSFTRGVRDLETAAIGGGGGVVWRTRGGDRSARWERPGSGAAIL